jgi:hypothetical protein
VPRGASGQYGAALGMGTNPRVVPLGQRGWGELHYAARGMARCRSHQPRVAAHKCGRVTLGYAATRVAPPRAHWPRRYDAVLEAPPRLLAVRSVSSGLPSIYWLARLCEHEQRVAMAFLTLDI